MQKMLDEFGCKEMTGNLFVCTKSLKIPTG